MDDFDELDDINNNLIEDDVETPEDIIIEDEPEEEITETKPEPKQVKKKNPQDRINALTRKYREEQRIRLELEKKANELETKIFESSKTNNNTYDAMDYLVDEQIKTLQILAKKAAESGEVTEQIEYQNKANQLQIYKSNIANAKQVVKEPEVKQPQVVNDTPEELQNWLDEVIFGSWTEQEKQKADMIFRQVERGGIAPLTDEFFEEVNRRLKKQKVTYYMLEQDEEDGEETKQKERLLSNKKPTTIKRRVAEPSNVEMTTKPAKLKVTSEQVRAMKDLGVDTTNIKAVKEYLKEWDETYA